MYVSTPALILKTQKYKEYDEIITAFTKKFGKLNLFAHSSKRMKSRLLAGTQVFSYVNMEIDLRQNGSRLYTSVPIKSNYEFSQNLHKYYLVAYICEILDRTQAENQTELKFFDKVIRVLDIIREKECDLRLLRLIFEIHLTDSLGIRPDLDRCEICGQSSTDMMHNVNMTSGSVVCDNCTAKVQAKLFRLDKNLIRFMKYVYNKSIEVSVNAKISPILVDMLEEFNMNYIHTFYGELKLNSFDILKQEEHYDKLGTGGFGNRKNGSDIQGSQGGS